MFDCLAAYTLAIYSKYVIVQRGIKSIFSGPAHCQNLNTLNRRKTIQQLKTISDNVLTAYIFTIKGNSIDLWRWQPLFKVYECAVGLQRFHATAFTHKATRCRRDWLSPRYSTSSTNRVTKRTYNRAPTGP